MSKEKKKLIGKTRIIGIICTLLASVGLIIAGLILDRNREKEVVTVFKADGTELGKIRREKNEVLFECEPGYMTYLGVVWEEAKKEEDELKLLEGSVIYTFFDQEKYDIVSEAMESVASEEYGDAALCLTDTKGCIYATYRKVRDPQDNINYVLAGTSGGSAMKPLAVYAPALEAGEIRWNTITKDEPLFYYEGKNGEKEPWPVNAEDHGGKDYLVSDAVKYSINTIAVRILKDYGPLRSVDFLEERFGIDLSREKDIAASQGEDEILGNLAFGALRNGVNVKDMAGYYQAFANGGLYQPAYAIERILVDGKEVYTHTDQQKRVFMEETAYICNRLLKTVLTEGGTGEKAYIEGLDICGKTGTSDNFRDYWFVGFTPEYVCASWCGGIDGKINREKTQIQVFRKVMEGLHHDQSRNYPVPDSVKPVEICRRTGKEAGPNCEEKETGYFTTDSLPEKCDE